MKNQLTKEQFIEEVFDEISEKVTFDFSKDDWLKLWERTIEGDPISAEMLMRLWQNKVIPNLSEEGRKFFK